MSNIIDFSIYQKKEPTQQSQPEATLPSEELGIAIQILIEQLRKEPLQRIS